MKRQLFLVSAELLYEFKRQLNIYFHRSSLYLSPDGSILFYFMRPNDITIEDKLGFGLSLEDLTYSFTTRKPLTELLEILNSFDIKDDVNVILIEKSFSSHVSFELIKFILDSRYRKLNYFIKKTDILADITDLSELLKQGRPSGRELFLSRWIVKHFIWRVTKNFFRLRAVEDWLDINSLYLLNELKKPSTNRFYVGDVLVKKLINSRAIDGRLPIYYQNRYIYLDRIIEKEWLDYESVELLDIPEEVSILETKDAIYLTEHKSIPKIESSSIKRLNRSFSELFFYSSNNFSNYEIMTSIEKIYDRTDLDERGEIKNLVSPAIEFDRNIYEQLLFLKNREELKSGLEELLNYLRDSYSYSSFYHLSKCPVCKVGYIYSNSQTYFCSECDFLLSKPLIKKQLGFDLTKRMIRLLYLKGSFQKNGYRYYLKETDSGEYIIRSFKENRVF